MKTLACSQKILSSAFRRSSIAPAISENVSVMCWMTNDQIRSVSSGGGPVEGVTVPAAWRNGLLEAKGTGASFTAAGSVSATDAVKSASGEWSPLQHFCPELGVWGVAGAEPWQPESSLEAISALPGGVNPMVQEACNKSAAIATSAATLPHNRHIAPRATYNSRQQACNPILPHLHATRAACCLSSRRGSIQNS